MRTNFWFFARIYGSIPGRETILQRSDVRKKQAPPRIEDSTHGPPESSFDRAFRLCYSPRSLFKLFAHRHAVLLAGTAARKWTINGQRPMPNFLQMGCFLVEKSGFFAWKIGFSRLNEYFCSLKACFYGLKKCSNGPKKYFWRLKKYFRRRNKYFRRLKKYFRRPK